MEKIVIPLGNGYNLVAERNPDGMFDKELYIGVEKDGGEFIQDLAVVRPGYEYNENGEIDWFGNKTFEVFVYDDKDLEDYTEKFDIGLYEEE